MIDAAQQAAALFDRCCDPNPARRPSELEYAAHRDGLLLVPQPDGTVIPDIQQSLETIKQRHTDAMQEMRRRHQLEAEALQAIQALEWTTPAPVKLAVVPAYDLNTISSPQ